MTTRRANRRLTEAQFAAASRGLRIQAANLQLAKAVMVEGVRVTDLADAQGVKHQRVSATVKRIFEAHLRNVDFPADWESVNVTVPQPLAKEIRSMADKAVTDLHRRRQISQAISGLSHETVDPSND